MGDQKININPGEQERYTFLGHLLDDLKALNQMLKNDMIEDDIVRIGAEQEFCLVNEQWRPARNALEIIKEIDDPHFTTELALYNLEINLDPLELSGNAFKRMESQLNSLLDKARIATEKHSSKVILTGILPSISKHQLELEFLTPYPRYFALNELVKKAKGGNFRLYFIGVDELSLMHDSVMFESCNTSFQLHLQIDPKDFASSYNWAQAIAGPVLALCVNSPLLLGKELWSETRIALFQQSVDTRMMSRAINYKQARVTFGNSWGKGDIVDFYKNELSLYRTLLTKEIEHSSLSQLKEGKIPKLEALGLHNGTIYRWNRPCYGVGNGKPHIRIENRYLPSGPTVRDEIANFVFWAGLMVGRPAEFDNLPEKMAFEDAKSNFIRAARYGSETIMNWMDKQIPLNELVLSELMPIAKMGLEKMKIDPEDIDNYLEVIKNRVHKHTGSQWMVKNYRNLKRQFKKDDALIALTESIYQNQQTGKPISDWPAYEDFTTFNSRANKVGHIMTSTLVTADINDSAKMTLLFMKWNNIHHLPIVNTNRFLKGLITWGHLKQYGDKIDNSNTVIHAHDIMLTDIITVKTSTLIKDAIDLMKKHEIGCLPVVQDGQLVGIITEKDIQKFDNA